MGSCHTSSLDLFCSSAIYHSMYLKSTIALTTVPPPIGCQVDRQESSVPLDCHPDEGSGRTVHRSARPARPFAALRVTWVRGTGRDGAKATRHGSGSLVPKSL